MRYYLFSLAMMLFPPSITFDVSPHSCANADFLVAVDNLVLASVGLAALCAVEHDLARVDRALTYDDAALLALTARLLHASSPC